MAEITNYGTLKAWVANTGHRSDLTADIPGFIQSAEAMIARRIRAIEIVTTATLDETDRADGPLYNLPSDFLGARAVTGTQSSAGYSLEQVSLPELYRYGLTGTPVVYSLFNSFIEFRASPATDTEFTLIYYAKPAAFSSDSDTNTLLAAHPDLYKHASMYWFHIHTQDVELAEAHGNSFDRVADDINALAEEIRGAASVADQYNYASGSTM